MRSYFTDLLGEGVVTGGPNGLQVNHHVIARQRQQAAHDAARRDRLPCHCPRCERPAATALPALPAPRQPWELPTGA